MQGVDLKMNKKYKIMFDCAIAIVLLVLIILFFFDHEPEFEHIKDTNGADDYSLTTITDKNIINLDCGPLYETNDDKLDYSKCSHPKFSGTMQIFGEDYTVQNLQIEIADLKVYEGNLKVVLLVDDEIVHEFKLNESNQSFTLDKVSGYVSIRIGGESANFEMEHYVNEVDD